MELLTKMTLNVAEWPSYSFDLNRLENLWQSGLSMTTTKNGYGMRSSTLFNALTLPKWRHLQLAEDSLTRVDPAP